MAPEAYANNPVTTVSSGGTTALAAGDTETWTVASSSGFPAATTGSSQFHVMDPAQTGEIILVTNVSGTTWSVTRGAENTTPVAHTSGFTVEQVVTAGVLTALSTSPVWFNALDFGADPTGANDSTTAIQAAITAAASSKGVAYVPTGTYKTTAALSISSPNIVLCGDGIDQTIIQPESGATFNVIETPIAPASTGSGYTIAGVTIRDMTLDCSLMDGTTAGAGNGIFWFGAIQCTTTRVRIYECPNWAIIFDATADNDAYDCIVSECRIESCTGEINVSYNTAARIYNNYLSGPMSDSTAAAQPVYTNVSSSSYALAMYSANCLVQGNVFGQGAATVTNPAINLTNTGTTRIIGNFFINTSGAAIESQAGGHNQIIVGNEFSGCCEGTSYSGPCLYIGADGTVITGNVFDVSNGDFTNMTWAIQVNGSAGSCSVTGNTLLAGSDGVIDEGTDWYIAGNIEGSTTAATGGTGPDFTGPVAALVTDSGGASSTAEFQIGTLTIPAGQPKSTTLYQFIVHGGIAAGTASQTVEFRARIGSLTGTVMFDSGTITPKVTTGSDWFINANIAFRGTGSTELDCWGVFLESFSTGSAVSHPVIETYKSVTTTSAIEIVLTAQFTASNSSNSASTTQGAIVGVSR